MDNRIDVRVTGLACKVKEEVSPDGHTRTGPRLNLARDHWTGRESSTVFAPRRCVDVAGCDLPVNNMKRV